MNEVFFIQVVLFPAILVYTQIKQSLTVESLRRSSFRNILEIILYYVKICGAWN